MAAAVDLSRLTEELIEATGSISRQSFPQRFKLLRDSSLRKLDGRHHNFLSTNPFAVQETLEGIEERFRVLNRDDLADALRERLESLFHQAEGRDGAVAFLPHGFSPEVLTFLLGLSDQPVQKSRISDLRALTQKPVGDHGPQLKWADIATEDGWGPDLDIWKNVDFTCGSSDEDLADDLSTTSEIASRSSLGGQHRARATDFVVETQHESLLRRIQESQSWRLPTASHGIKSRVQTVVISELQTVRETLWMLAGRKNDLYDSQGKPSTRYRVKHASPEVFGALLSSFGRIGQSLAIIRRFSSREEHQQAPLVDVLRDGMGNQLRNFDKEVSTIEAQYLDIGEDTVVSLVKIFDEVQSLFLPMSRLTAIIHQLEDEKSPVCAYRHLELLFDAAGLAQIEANAAYSLLGTLFFDCFRVYLRPIRQWMEEGVLLEQDEQAFFITADKTEAPLAHIWQSRFKLRERPDGALLCPRFLKPAANKILRTGKSVVILKHLGQYEPQTSQVEPPLDFETLEYASASFVPFADIFTAGMDRWLESKHHAASATVRKALFDCGLLSFLDGMEQIYLMSDGCRAGTFTNAIFHNLDQLNTRWHDHFMLTEMAQEAYDTVVDPYRITVAAYNDGALEEMGVARRSVRKCLPDVTITYRLPWQIRIVLSDEAMSHYQSVFTFLLQLRRAAYALHEYRLLSQDGSDDANEQAMYHGIRARLLWFCDILQSYLCNMVLCPLISSMREELGRAEDIDAMIAVHSSFTKRMYAQACLVSRLDPIRQAILDILDLTIRLEEARHLQIRRAAEERREHSRLSATTPPEHSGWGGSYLDLDEGDKESSVSGNEGVDRSLETDATYGDMLREIRSDLDRHLKFVCGGLKAVARATGDGAAGKWDTLAEMLEAGVDDKTW